MNRTVPRVLSDGYDTRKDSGERSRLPKLRARIVVVDDDADVRELVTNRLTSARYDVHAEMSGVELLRVTESILECVESERWPLDKIDLIDVDNRDSMTGAVFLRLMARPDGIEEHKLRVAP